VGARDEGGAASVVILPYYRTPYMLKAWDGR